jgi:hypothetical protein
MEMLYGPADAELLRMCVVILADLFHPMGFNEANILPPVRKLNGMRRLLFPYVYHQVVLLAEP